MSMLNTVSGCFSPWWSKL